MAQIKTKAGEHSVADFLGGVEHPVRRADADTMIAIMERVTGLPPVMWGPSIIGFGAYHYRYDSGHEGEMCRIGFSPRKANLVFYLSGDKDALLGRLGKHKRGKGCIYVNRLADVDLAVLEDMIALSWATMAERFPD
jgi:hypothetical protein